MRLLLALLPAACLASPAHEKRLQLDFSALDAHLRRASRCLRRVPVVRGGREGAKRGDCCAFRDSQLLRCERLFGEELRLCMEEEEPADDEELVQELKQLRKDLVRCYEEKALRPYTIQSMDGPLKRCGAVQLIRVLPDIVLDHSEEHLRKFLADEEEFRRHHPGGEVIEEGGVVHELPTNLPGGRFEIVPPANGGTGGLVQFMTSQFNTPSFVSNVWGNDHRDQAQLAYLVVRAQVNDTKKVTDQPWRRDGETTEDLRAKVFLHSWKEADGPLDILPTSHRLQRWLRPPAEAYPRPWRLKEAGKGDMFFHYPRLQHREAKRRGKRAKITLDFVLHSVNRSFHEDSERDVERVRRRLLDKEHARSALELFKELWEEKRQRNREVGDRDEF